MPNDLERAFGALEADTDRAQLLPAAEVRRLAGRRSRNASIAAVLTVAVLVAGVTVGSRRMLAGDARAPAAAAGRSTRRACRASPSPSPVRAIAPSVAIGCTSPPPSDAVRRPRRSSRRRSRPGRC